MPGAAGVGAAAANPVSWKVGCLVTAVADQRRFDGVCAVAGSGGVSVTMGQGYGYAEWPGAPPPGDCYHGARTMTHTTKPPKIRTQMKAMRSAQGFPKLMGSVVLQS